MRTLNATFEGILQGDIHRLQGFVAKITGLLKSNPATTRTFYFAESFDEIDSSAVDGLLYNVGSIRQQIDFYSGSYSFGGFNIEVMQLQDTINDIIADYHFTNQPVEIYYFMEGATRNTTTPVLPKLYVGKIESIESDMDRIVFGVANDARLLDKDFPPSINDADAGDAVGKVARYVYGDHSGFKYGTNDTDGTPLQKNKMIKAIPSYSAGGGWRWIVGGNGSDLTIAATGALWIWHAEYKRFMQVTTAYSTGVDTQGNKYVTITPQAGYFVDVYDYIMPTNVSRSGTPNWGSPANAINANFDITDSNGYAEVNIPDADGGLSILNVLFSDVPEYATLSKHVMFGVDDNGLDTFTISGYGATSTVEAVGGYSMRTITSADGSLPNKITFQASNPPGGGNKYARVSNCFLRLGLRVVGVQDLYVGVVNTIATQRNIINDICADIGITYTDNTDVPAVTLAPVLDQQRPVGEWLSDIAKNGACTVYITGQNECTVDKPDLSATADITINSADVYNVKVKQSKLSDVVNDMNIDYYQDNFSDGFSGNLSDDNSDSDTLYDTREKIMKSEMLFDATEAGKVLDYYVNGTTDTFFSRMRNVIEFELRDLVGTTPYQSGTFKAYVQLELGDYFSIDNGLDTYNKCNGESCNGKVFKILYWELSVGKMKIKAIEI